MSQDFQHPKTNTANTPAYPSDSLLDLYEAAPGRPITDGIDMDPPADMSTPVSPDATIPRAATIPVAVTQPGSEPIRTGLEDREANKAHLEHILGGLGMGPTPFK